MQILRVRNREKDIEVVNQIYNAFHYFFFSFQTSQKHFVFIVYRNTQRSWSFNFYLENVNEYFIYATLIFNLFSFIL